MISELGFKFDRSGDFLTNTDLECLATIIASRYSFKEVIGVPPYGLRLQKALEKYKSKKGVHLIVDIVYKQGKTIDTIKETLGRWKKTQGVVLYSETQEALPSWVDTIFTREDFQHDRI